MMMYQKKSPTHPHLRARARGEGAARAAGTIVEARRKDGAPAARNDRVLLCLKGGQKTFATIIEVAPPRRFLRSPDAMRVYKVRCDDGLTRPCLARHILAVFDQANRWARRNGQQRGAAR